ncbi:MAG: response regulator [Gammaproteobacteria bacterium]
MDFDHNILIVDDEPDLRKLLCRYLTENNLTVSSVVDGHAMDDYLKTNSVDLFILDLMLPGEDGLSIAKRLRQTMDPAIIMLSAHGEAVDRIVGLEIGADDYLAKPFNPRELLARIRIQLRRIKDKSAAQINTSDVIHFGDFQFDCSRMQLKKHDIEIDLTQGDYSLLQILLENPNRILPRDFLINQLNDFDKSPFDRSVDVRVTRLRKKIESDPSSPQFLRTIRGKGYLFSLDNN